jgi:DNA invertase Pin-like site-specific DNA recombinase
LKLLTAYAAEKGFAVVQHYVDIETAKKAGRTGFTAMVEFFRGGSKAKTAANSCRVLLVEKTDRLYRNLKDWVTLDELDLEIHFVKENVIFSHDSRSSEKFIHGIKVLMAKNYIDNLSEETRKWDAGKSRTSHLSIVRPFRLHKTSSVAKSGSFSPTRSLHRLFGNFLSATPRATTLS